MSEFPTSHWYCFWWTWPCVPKVPPPKNKFVISLKYFKKKVKDKYDILHEDKHQSFLQAGSIAFTDHSQACPKY